MQIEQNSLTSALGGQGALAGGGQAGGQGCGGQGVLGGGQHDGGLGCGGPHVGGFGLGGQGALAGGQGGPDGFFAGGGQHGGGQHGGGQPPDLIFGVGSVGACTAGGAGPQSHSSSSDWTVCASALHGHASVFGLQMEHKDVGSLNGSSQSSAGWLHMGNT